MDLAFIIRKAEHQMLNWGLAYTPTLAQVDLMTAVFATTPGLTPNETVVLRHLQAHQSASHNLANVWAREDRNTHWGAASRTGPSARRVKQRFAAP